MNGDLWKRKLRAFLHDPPHKAYDFGPQHERDADAIATSFGLLESDWPSRQADWEASASDRFVLPRISAGKWLPSSVFRHPFSGQEVPLDYPDASTAAQVAYDAVPLYGDIDGQTRFWLAWRCWMPQTASINPAMAFLPAETRVPDHSIWHHISVCSAIEATRCGDGSLHPAFLLFNLGPVQEFIAQARSTRDLWSGSYLIAWLMAHALHGLAEQLGPDCIVFPSLRGQPLYDWLNRRRLQEARFRQKEKESLSFWDEWQPTSEQLTIPSLPNRFLAVVPADFDVASVVVAPMMREWERIADACRAYLPALPGAPLWDDQVEKAFQTAWQVWPWKNPQDAIALWKQFDREGSARLACARKAAEDIPAADRDGRCYPLRSGWAWSANYALCAHRLDARRQTHDFRSAAAIGPATDSRRSKDALSGVEEAVTDEAWLDRVDGDERLRHLFRKSGRLGAANLVKRVWHAAYLDPEHGIKAPRFVSAPDIAGEDDDSSSRYIAVLALDGDDMGRWISGDKTPPVKQALAATVAAWFADARFREWLDNHRPVSPSYHLQFSEALAAFGRLVPAIVAKHGGQLIYAGGDDVLAMLPADRAIGCAHELRRAFQGDAHGMVRQNGAWLLVPGPRATVSVGIAIGHEKAPLQDLVRAAHQAERRAKHCPGKDALSVTLFKRSGETIEWGAGFQSLAWPVLEFLQSRYRSKERGGLCEKPAISGKFPYRLAELLGRYGCKSVFDPALAEIAKQEFAFAMSRQTNGLGPDRVSFLDKAGRWLDELAAKKATIADFLGLFAVEAFLARQGED